MTEPLLPEKLEELMAGYVLGNLSPEEAEQLMQLLAERPELRTEVHRLQEVLELMPYALPEVTPPQSLRSAIIEAATTEIERDATPTTSFNLTWRAWGKITGSLAALLVLVLGIDNYRLRQQIETLQAQTATQKDVISMLQNPTTHLVTLRGMDKASAASGSIVMTPNEPKAVLILQKLPVLPTGQFYQVWAVVNGERIPSGQFNASSRGTVLVKIPVPSRANVTALVVTVEDSHAPTHPTGPMVVTSSL
jgi:anti-sigma-K factor RskA